MTEAAPIEDFRFSLLGRVRNLGFSPSPQNALFPLYEAVSNAIHAVEARFNRDAAKRGEITVTVLRANELTDEVPVSGFVVEDNGIGLNDSNWAAFRTADTPQKVSRGGKGVGRLSWLKVFQTSSIISRFDRDGSRLRRTFVFSLPSEDTSPISDYRIDRESQDSDLGTLVRLEPFLDGYAQACPSLRVSH